MGLAAWASLTNRFSCFGTLPPPRLPSATGAAGVGSDASGDDVWRLDMTAVMARRSLLATWILSGIDAMGMKLSLYHMQKCVQVYDTQIMICDK